MKNIFLAASMLCTLGSTAMALCHDFQADGTTTEPDVIICYGSKCDLTRVAVTCNGGGNNFTDYEIGWRFGYTYEVHSNEDTMQEYIGWKGAAIPPEKWKKIRVFKLKDGTAVEVD